MREAFLERQQLALTRAEVAFGKQRHCPAELQAVADAAEQRLRVLDRSLDWDDPAGGADESPLGLASHHAGRVGEHVDARLDREDHQDRHRVEPAEMVGDDDVRARTRDVLAAVHGEAEAEAQQRDGDGADDAIGQGGTAADGQQVDGRHLRRRLARGDCLVVGTPAQSVPLFIDCHRHHAHEAGGVQDAPPVVATEVRHGCRPRLGVRDPELGAVLQRGNRRGRAALEL